MHRRAFLMLFSARLRYSRAFNLCRFSVSDEFDNKWLKHHPCALS